MKDCKAVDWEAALDSLTIDRSIEEVDWITPGATAAMVLCPTIPYYSLLFPYYSLLFPYYPLLFPTIPLLFSTVPLLFPYYFLLLPTKYIKKCY